MVVREELARKAFDYAKTTFNNRMKELRTLRAHVNDAGTIEQFQDAIRAIYLTRDKLQSLRTHVDTFAKNYKEFRSKFTSIRGKIDNALQTIANLRRAGGVFDKKRRELEKRAAQTAKTAPTAKAAPKPAMSFEEATKVAAEARAPSDVRVNIHDIRPSRRAAVGGNVPRAIAKIAALEKEESNTFNEKVKGPLVGMHKALNNFVANEFNPRVGAIYAQLRQYDAQDQAAESNMQELERESAEIAGTTQAVIHLLQQVSSIAEQMKVSPQERAQELAAQLNLTQFARGLADDIRTLHDALSASTNNYREFLQLRETEEATIQQRKKLLDGVGDQVAQLRQAFARLEQQFKLHDVERTIGSLENELEDQRKELDAFVKGLKKQLDDLTLRVQQASKASQA